MTKPIKFADTPGPQPTPSPVFGQHSDEILGAYGYSAWVNFPFDVCCLGDPWAGRENVSTRRISSLRTLAASLYKSADDIRRGEPMR
jgi:hypothetical protein